MINKLDFIDFFKINSGIEFSKEEIINIFSKSNEEENEIDDFLSELEVDCTYASSYLFVSCKSGSVYFKWIPN